VELVIGDKTEIGYIALINEEREGMLYRNEVFQKIRKGQRITGFIKKVRDDGKIDLSLQKPGPEKVHEVSQKIVDRLKQAGGSLSVTDQSPPELIYNLFGVSKKTFKKAIGSLYKSRIILLESNAIKLVKKGH
jgi:predicted RNA-binding protein (virulence factor B family)